MDSRSPKAFAAIGGVNANLPIRVVQIVNREIGIPGVATQA
jgi:hypothetical protein